VEEGAGASVFVKNPKSIIKTYLISAGLSPIEDVLRLGRNRVIALNVNEH